MRQIVQRVSGGPVRVVDVPAPAPTSTEVLVATSCSAVSPGTERAVRALATAGLLGKARARPDLVRSVVARARQHGVLDTVRAVRSRLDDEITLGYSACGVAIEVGPDVAGIRAGMRVATGGAAHGELQAVAGLLTVPVPDEVDDDSAAFTTMGAVALQALRLARVGPGDRVVVVGLGMVGQLVTRIAVASGLSVLGIDTDPAAVARSGGLPGVEVALEQGADTTARVVAWTRGRGADAVLVAASAPSSEPARRSLDLLRDRGTLVVVGDVGLDLPRAPLYDRELTVRVARSYGPGRYEPSYEEWGVDLPVGLVPHTARRNMEAVLDLMASGRLGVGDLVTHRVPVESAAELYAGLGSRSEPAVGVLLTYGSSPSDPARLARSVTIRPVPPGQSPGIAVIGAGTFARRTAVPMLRAAGLDRFVAAVSPSGTSARSLADREGFARASSDAAAEVAASDVDLVAVLSPHDSHAELVVAALRAGKHVYCEKPLAVDLDGLAAVAAAHRDHPGSVVLVGHNRRWSPAVDAARSALGREGSPLVMTYRVNAGRLDRGHWYHDRRQGGRLVGEVGHFVDTAASLAGGPPVRWWAAGERASSTVERQDLAVMVEFADGSVAAITYAAGGHASTPKERLEVLGRGHTVVIDDFTSCEVDGRRVWHGTRDKGHARQFEELAAALAGHPSAAFTEMVDSEIAFTVSRAVIECAAGTGGPVEP